MFRPTGAGCDPTSFTIDPQSLGFTDLVPGQAQRHDVHVKNLGTDPITVTAHVAHADGPLFSGDTPLELSVSTTAGPPAVVAPGDQVDLIVAALLPAGAGNGYAGTHGDATVRLVATTRCTADGSGPTDGALAITGITGAGTVLLLAAGLVLIGALLRRRKETDR